MHIGDQKSNDNFKEYNNCNNNEETNQMIFGIKFLLTSFFDYFLMNNLYKIRSEEHGPKIWKLFFEENLILAKNSFVYDFLYIRRQNLCWRMFV